jgi:HTH-type transcriptional regulator/antitoxin HipB
MNDQLARTPKQIGDAIRRCRRIRGLSQKELGDKAQLRQATISGLEAGEPGTQLRTLFDVLTVLDLELLIRPRTKLSNDKIEQLF